MCFRSPKLAAFAAGVAATLCGLALLQVASAVPRGYSPYRKLDIFAQVLTQVENNYVEPVDGTQLIYGALQGMMRTLDPHSAFMTPEQYQQIKEETQGEFGGIGIEVEIRDGWITVVAPIEGSPAQQAGLKAGDQIRGVDGKSTEGMAMHEVVKAMRGPRGSAVRLTLFRAGNQKPVEVKIIRDIIKLISVDSSMPAPGVGYLRLKVFQEGSDLELQKALDALAAKGPLKGLVLDLRNNPGGLLEQAVRVSDLFLVSGTIVSTRGKGGKKMDEERAHSPGTYRGFPMICLINAGSASASEIVAGALQDHKRAVVLGTRSFGKGSVQTIFDMEDGSGLKLTVARYYTPAGRSIQELGIVPDILVPEQAPAQRKVRDMREKDLEGHLRKEGKQEPGARHQKRLEDFQLQSALDYLQALEIFKQQKS